MDPKIIFIDGKPYLRLLALPPKMIKFVIKSANAEVMRKLYFSCKYFYKKATYCIVDKINFESCKKSRLEVENFDDVIDVYENDEFELFNNIWVTQEVHVEKYKSHRFLLPKVVRCDARLIIIEGGHLSYEEYKILTKSGKVEELELEYVRISHPDGSDVAIENLLKYVPAAYNIFARKCHSTTQTMEELLKIQWKRKFNSFYLQIGENIPLDKDLFDVFIKKNVGENVKALFEAGSNFETYHFQKPISCEIPQIESHEPPKKETESANQKGLPKPIINYIVEAANENVMKKFHRISKYFFKKAPYLFVDYIDYDRFTFRYKSIELENFKGKNCWVTDTYYIDDSEALARLEFLAPKIRRCNKISSSTYISQKNFELISKFESLKGLYVYKIYDENRDIITLENFLTPLINLEKIAIEGCQVTNLTMNSLIELPFKNKIKKLYIVDIEGMFDFKIFFAFLQKALAPKAEVLIHFVDFDENEEGRIVFNKSMKLKLETWKPKKDRPAFKVIPREDTGDIDRDI